MPLTQHTLTGTIKKADGSNWAGAEIEIAPVSAIVGNGSVIPIQPVIVTAAEESEEEGAPEAGSFEVTLYSLPDSYISYSVKFPTDEKYLFNFPDEDSVLDELLANQFLNDGNLQLQLLYLTELIQTVLETVGTASGPAGGVLSGSYPNPGFAVNMAEQTELDSAIATRQPLDADLTAIAALDSTVAGALVTDGAGWIKKTYAQLKTALGLTKSDVGLSNVDNTSDANKPVSTAQQAALDLKQNSLGFTPENASNKSTDVNADQASNTKYAAVKAVFDWAVSLFARKSNNLSDLADIPTARTNLGLGTLATQSGTFSGTSSGANTGDQDLSGLAVKANNLSDLTNVGTARTNLGINTTANQTDSVDKRFVTDAQLTSIGTIGAKLSNQTGIALLSTTTVNTNVGTKQTLFTVPVGFRAIVTLVAARDESTDLSANTQPVYFGWNAGATDWLSAISADQLANFDGSGIYTLMLNASSVNSEPSAIGTAGQDFGILFQDASITGTLKIDVFGFLIAV